jgi:hypothetical protein
MFSYRAAKEIIRVEVSSHPSSPMSPDAERQSSGCVLGNIGAVADAVDFVFDNIDVLGGLGEERGQSGYELHILVLDVFWRALEGCSAARGFFPGEPGWGVFTRHCGAVSVRDMSSSDRGSTDSTSSAVCLLFSVAIDRQQCFLLRLFPELSERGAVVYV